jgi:hypothetical protein
VELFFAEALNIRGVPMISKKGRIEEFVEAVKSKKSQEVIELANREATKADLLVLKKRNSAKIDDLQAYSRQLKQLIKFHRYVIKPRHRVKTTYNLYMTHWGIQSRKDLAGGFGNRI